MQREWHGGLQVREGMLWWLVFGQLDTVIMGMVWEDRSSIIKWPPSNWPLENLYTFV